MKRCFLFEDIKLPKLPVIFSPKIRKKINLIEYINHNNKEALLSFYSYLNSMENYISNPVIAWDNMGRYTHSSSGAIHIKELGYDVMFLLVNADINYLYVIEMCLNPEGCEWDVPPYLTT